MSQSIQPPRVPFEIADKQWKSVCRIGGVTGLLAALLFLSDILVMGIGPELAESASQWLALAQTDKLLGNLELFFSDLFGLALLIPFIFALYAALRRTQPVYAALVCATALLGMAAAFAANPNYALVYLQDQYASAATELQRSQILMAAEALFTAGNWGTGYFMGKFLVVSAMLAFSVLLLRSAGFSKGIAWLGILGHGLDWLHSIVMLLLTPLFNPAIAVAVSVPLLVIGGTLQLVWYPLVARWLLKQARQ